jgi:hypothetical protein
MFLSINDALVIVGLLLTSFQRLKELKIPKELKILNSPPMKFEGVSQHW